MNHLDRKTKKFQGTNVLKKCIYEIFCMLKNINCLRECKVEINKNLRNDFPHARTDRKK